MTDIRIEVKEYQDRYGFHVVRVRGNTGVPTDAKKAVQSGALSKQHPKPNDFQPGEGVALVLGNDIADLDLDHPMACRIAQHLVPASWRGFVFERVGKPFSHILLRVKGINKRYVFSDIKKEGEANKPLLELRGMPTLYTVLPPSPHPSGEEMTFVHKGVPHDVSEDDAVLLARAIAVATLVVLHYPSSDRHFAIGHLTGLLARSGMPENGVRAIVKAIVAEARDEESSDRLKFMETTLAKHAAGEPTTGGSKLKDLLGADVVARLYSWLRCVDDDTVVLDYESPMGAAREFATRLHTVEDVLATRHQADVFYRYEHGAYLEREDASVRADLYQFLEQAKVWKEVDTDDGREWRLERFEPNRARVENVLDAFCALAHLDSKHPAPRFLADVSLPPADELLVCRNGILHLPTRQLWPHTPRFYTHTSLDFDFDANAPTPGEWLKFLASVWPSDQESIDTLQEMFGYFLSPDTSQHKAFLLVGPKRSGKGTIGRVLERLIGERNYCHPTLHSLGERFGKESLINKHLAIISDARISGRTDLSAVAEAILSISGEDSQTVQRKHKVDWQGRLLTRFVFMSNELPNIGDVSGALASRFVILVMKESFYGREDLALFNRLVREVPGIMNWALVGRDRLAQRGHFVPPASATDTVKQFEEMGSPISLFVQDLCEIAIGAEVQKADLFFAWQKWCELNNIKNVGTTQVFGRNLRAALPNIGECQHRPARDWWWKGVRLLPNLPPIYTRVMP